MLKTRADIDYSNEGKLLEDQGHFEQIAQVLETCTDLKTIKFSKDNDLTQVDPRGVHLLTKM